MRYRTIALFGLLSVAAYAAEADALAIDANIQSRHLPYGAILDPVFVGPNSDQIVGYTHCGDSAIWTGHYLAAEAFRYKATRAAGALDNVRKAIAGLQALTDVTGVNLLARCAVPLNSPYLPGIQAEEAHNGLHTAGNMVWVGNTSRDQYAGAMFGLGVAYDMVDDAGVRDAISQLVTRLVDFLRGHAWNVVMPDGSVSTSFIVRPDQQLGFLQIARHVNPGRFSTAYDLNRILLSLGVITPIALEVTNDSSYFKFNLDYINFYNLVRLEGGAAQSIYEGAYDLLRAHTADHQNAFFDAIDRGLKGPRAGRDAELLALLDNWLKRPRRDAYTDLHGVVPVCGDQACQPAPVALRPPTDFLWQRTPFLLAAGGVGTVETAGIDYILPYWMARYYGLAPAAFTVQSAAAPSAAVAPDSIAAIYGSGFTPESGVLVRDSAGIERPAMVLYFSPGQINIVVPAGTAPGAATFTIGNQSATAAVRTVAPTLFTMNGNGSGVAAATAIGVQVFTCDPAGQCVATPIDVGSHPPVYLAFYGTGIRGRSQLANVAVTVNGISVPVQYAGAQNQYPGLDQVNVALNPNLRGSGESNVVLTVDGQQSNTVTLNIQ